MAISSGFFAAAGVVGRQPTIQADIELDHCTLTNGTAPCTAAPAAGLECYNTPYTCQDAANFDNDPKTYSFVSEKAKPEAVAGTIRYPVIKSVNTAPSKITPGQGLGQVASVTIAMEDFTDGDIDTDPYLSGRNYIAKENGSFFGKLLARNPYWEGRPLTTYFRYGAESASQRFIVDRFERETKGGRVSLIGKDPLKLVDGIKAQCPAANDGVTTSAIVGASATWSMDATSADQYPTAASYYRIDDEIIKATRAAGVFTIVTRGTWETTAADHSSGAKVQLCAAWEAVDMDDVLTDLLTNYAAIDPAYIPAADWQAEFTQWLSDFVLTNIVVDPTPVGNLINQLMIESGCNTWWDPYAEEIKFKADVPVLPTDPDYPPIKLNDRQNIIKDSLSYKVDTKQRVSQFWLYTGRRSYIGKEEDPVNYEILTVRADVTGQGALAYGSKAIKRIFCRWITDSQAGQTASRYLARFRHSPAIVRFDLDPQDAGLKTGQHFVLQSSAMQDVTGAPSIVQFECTSIHYDFNAQKIRVEGLQFRFQQGDDGTGAASRSALVAATGANDYTSATTLELTRAYVCDTATLKMSNGDAAYTVI
jgi:hypothetical protein